MIGTTSNHPFWSVDRRKYVQAGKLELGERVLTYSGDTKRVLSKLARPGPQPVYNLEVFAEHVYYVGKDGVLVHNQYLTSRPRDTQLGELKSGSVDELRYFNRGSRVGDDFDGHEVLQSAWLRDHLGLTRNKLPGSRNPSIALNEADHALVNGLQELATGGRISTMTARQNIEANIAVLREAQRRGADITSREINSVARRAVRFAKSQGVVFEKR